MSTSRVIIFAPYYIPGYLAGGPIRSIEGIIKSVPAEMDVEVVTRDRDLGQRTPYPNTSGRTIRMGNAAVTYNNVLDPRHWWLTIRRLRNEPVADITYVNSLWNPWFGILPVVLWRLRIIKTRLMLVAPRGQLTTGSLRLRAIRKRLLLKIWRLLLASKHSFAMHASTEIEAGEISRAFGHVPIVVSMDPSPLPEFARKRKQVSPFAHVLFLSRISPMKNLLNAAKAMSVCAQPVRFTVAGPIEDAVYWRRCVEQLRTLPPHVEVSHVGPVEPGKVRQLFTRHDVFLFPTYGENFGHVVAESLSASCSVICGIGTPWDEQVRESGGFLVHPDDIQEIGRAINVLTSLNPSERLEQSLRVAQVYETWWRARDRSNVLLDAMKMIANGYPPPLGHGTM